MNYTIATQNPILDQLLNNPNFIFGIILIFIGVIAAAIFFIIRGFLVKSFNYLSSAELAIFLVTVPKESAKEAAELKNLQSIQEDIAIAEMLYSQLAGVKAEKGPKTWFRGRQDNFSLEIVAHQGFISFYICAPRNQKQYFEQQIQATYPQANLQEVEDYNIFMPQGVVKGAYLKFSREYIFPIKTYKKSESDPLNALTNILSKLNDHEGAAIQIIARSASSWRHKGRVVASEMQQGKRLSEALAKGGFMSGLNRVFLIFNIIFFAFKTTKKKDNQLTQPEKVYHLSPLEEDMVKGIEEKISKAGVEANIRVVVSTTDNDQSNILIENIVNAFSQFNIYQFGMFCGGGVIFEVSQRIFGVSVIGKGK